MGRDEESRNHKTRGDSKERGRKGIKHMTLKEKRILEVEEYK